MEVVLGWTATVKAGRFGFPAVDDVTDKDLNDVEDE